MIVDERVFRETFVPSEIQHRDAEVRHLSHVIEPISRDESAAPTIVDGPTGVGKTCVTRFLLERLREEQPDIAGKYINCWQDYTRFRVLHSLLDAVGQTYDIHRRSTPHDELIARLTAYEGPQCLVILDEADQLEDKGILYDIHQIDRFSMILIANREVEILADADDRLVSRLTGCERVRFRRYDLDELVSILQRRVQWGLESDVIGVPEIELIADAAAGDARVALSILRTAANRARRDGHSSITEAVIRDAIPDARRDRRQRDLDALPRDHAVLYGIIDDHGSIAPGRLYEEYRNRVQDPKSERTLRKYLQKMDRYELIRAEGKSSERVYRCYDSG